MKKIQVILLALAVVTIKPGEKKSAEIRQSSL